LRILKAQFEKFPVDARRTPKRVLGAHLPDEHFQLVMKLWAASAARFPMPIMSKADPMPTHHSLGLHDRENLED